MRRWRWLNKNLILWLNKNLRLWFNNSLVHWFIRSLNCVTYRLCCLCKCMPAYLPVSRSVSIFTHPQHFRVQVDDVTCASRIAGKAFHVKIKTKVGLWPVLPRDYLSKSVILIILCILCLVTFIITINIYHSNHLGCALGLQRGL